MTACGSYRRGKATCGDLDLLVTHPREGKQEGLLEPLVAKLHKRKILTDDLAMASEGAQRKYMGVARYLLFLLFLETGSNICANICE